MRNLLFGRFVGGRGATGLLVLRLVAGLAMAIHGYGKIMTEKGFTPTAWMPPNAPVPGAAQAVAAFSEFLGGVCLMLGLLTPVACFFVVATMTVAIFAAHVSQGHPFVAPKPGGPAYESAAGYLAIYLMFLLVGPGVFSVDYYVFGPGRPRSADDPETVSTKPILS